jgi:HlyD family secretion protein
MESRISVGQQQFDGVITAISPEVVDNQVTGRVRFVAAIPDGLRQNQRVSARVLLESRTDVLTVRRGPFLDSGSGRVAYIVDGDLVHRHVIQAGSASISHVEILEGLQHGQTIVISDLAQFEGAETVLLSD